MGQKTTGREVAWILTGVVLMFNCWWLIASPLLEICGYPVSDMSFFLVGCIYTIAGAGIGLGISMHLNYKLQNLQKNAPDEEARQQLFKKYQDKEGTAMVCIWASGPILLFLAFLFSGESL